MCINSRQQAGISLIELIMFILIVGIAAVGILGVMSSTTSRGADPLLRKQAMAIAESMLEEIELQDLLAGGCAGTLGADGARANVNNVCAYNGYRTTAGILEFSSNAPVAGLERYNISRVNVTQIAALAGTPIIAGSGVMITVTAADPTGREVSVTGYRAGK